MSNAFGPFIPAPLCSYLKAQPRYAPRSLFPLHRRYGFRYAAGRFCALPLIFCRHHRTDRLSSGHATRTLVLVERRSPLPTIRFLPTPCYEGPLHYKQRRSRLHVRPSYRRANATRLTRYLFRALSPVYEYPLNGQWIMMDIDDGYILWTGIWKGAHTSPRSRFIKSYNWCVLLS